MTKRLLYGSAIFLGLALLAGIFVSRMLQSDHALSVGAPPLPPEPNPAAQAALALNSAQRVISDTLVAAQGAELPAEQLAAFEAALGQVYAGPLRGETRAKLLKYETTLPLFMASEEALFKCLRGPLRVKNACEPTPRYLDLLHEGVAAGNISKEEADKYLDILRSMKDPSKRPALPDGGLDFMEKESAMRVDNMRKIVDVLRRAEQTAR